MHNQNKFYMADIIINNPVNIWINFQEFDKNLPSLKINCVLRNELVKGKYDLEFNFWTLCTDFDSFCENHTNYLKDLSGIERFLFDEEKLIINPSFKNKTINFDCRIMFVVDEEVKQNIKKKLSEFPSWW